MHRSHARHSVALLLPATLLAGLVAMWTASAAGQAPSPAKPAPAPAAPLAATPPAKPEPKPEAKPAPAPAATPPAATPPAKPEPKPLVPKVRDLSGQEVSLAVLTHPAIAERFKLTDAQRAQIATLVADRDVAVNKTPTAQRAAKLEEAEQKIAAVLTDAQRADFIKEPPEPLLKFQFRYQPWFDVLEEVARQAGLSLSVGDAPPPGTFNFTSDKEFTPSQAIDVLNSFLVNKGFALIHRDKLLALVDLSVPLPDGLVPQVTLEEAAKRGQFEWVSSLIPLEGRPAATVSKEIEPLLGTYGKAIPLTTSGQVLVTHTAGTVKAIATFIKAMPPVPVAAKPAPPQPPAKPEVPTLHVYELKGLNPEMITKLAETLAPAPGKVFVDPKTEQLTVHAVPSVHAVLKTALEQLKTGVPSERQPKLELYAVEELLGQQLVKSLETVAPTVKMWIDRRSGKMAVWGPPAEQATIKQIVEKLGPGGGFDRERQVEVYPLTKADPTTTVTLLQTLYPRAKLAADLPTKSLVAIATATEQKGIREILKQLQPDKPGPDSPELKFYPLTHSSATQLTTILKTLVPKAEVTFDAANKQLMVVAPPIDQATVKATVEQYEKGAPKEDKAKLVVYPVTPTQRKRFQAALTTLSTELTGVTILTDTEPGELAVWARPEQHKTIADLLKQFQLEMAGADKYQLGAYPVANADPTNTLAMLKSLHPNVQVLHDTKSGRFLVWAHPSELAAVKASIEQIQTPVPADKQPQFDSYLLHGADTSTIVANLQTIVPNAKLTLDAKTNKLVVWGTAAEQALVRTALAKFTRAGSEIEATPQLEIYRLGKVDPSAAVATLQTVVPDAKLTADAAAKSIMAVAVPADHKTIRAVIEQLESDKPGPHSPQLKFYTLAQTPSTAMVTLLQSLAPKSQVTLDPGGKRLTVLATASDHVTLKSAIEQIEKLAATEEKNKLVSYAVTASQRKRFQSLATSLSTELPGIQIVAETDPNELSIMAKPSQHVVIADMLEQLNRDVSATEKYQLSAYPLRTGDAPGVVTLLKSLFPNAQFTHDAKAKRIMVWASAAEQAAIGAAIQKIDAATPADAQDKLMVYPVPDLDITAATKVLQEMVTDVKFNTDTKAGTLLAWGAPADHVTIAKVLKQMQEGADVDRKPTMVAYPVPQGDLTAIAQIVRALVPKATVTVDAKSSSLFATAAAADHQLIRQTVEQMTKKETTAAAPRFIRYAIPNATAANVSTLVTLLTQQFPNAHFGPGLEPGQLIAWARPADHETIKSAIDVITEKGKIDNAKKLLIYELETGGATTVTNVTTVLQSMFPDGGFGPWVGPRQLAAYARPGDHAKIKQMIDELVREPSPGNKPRMVVYTIESAGPGGAAAVMATLRQILPDVQLTVGAEPNKIVAWARPQEHVEIRKAIRTLAKPEPPATAPKVTVYTVESSGAAGVTGMMSMLRTMFPDAQVSPGADADKLVVLARPAEHVKIAAALAEMSKKEPPEKARRLAAYPFVASSPSSPYYALPLLRQMFPDAQFSVSADGDKIIAFAKPSEHAQIKTAVAELAQKDSPENARQLTIYTLDSAPAGVAGAISLLTNMFPDARFQAGAEPNKIAVLARPSDHKLIAPAVAEVGKKDPAEKAKKIVVYPFKSTSATASYYTLAALRTMFPEAIFSTGAEPDKLVVFARPDDHTAIKAAIDEVSKEDDPKNARQMTIYTVKLQGATVSGIIATLTLMYPDATFSVGTELDKVVAYARPDEQKKIAKSVEEFNKPESAERAKRIVVYPFKSTSATAASYTLAALRMMFPEATFSMGAEPDKLVVFARGEEHVKIRQAIRDVSKGDSPKNARQMTIYTVKLQGATVSGIIATLTLMYPDATFSVGTEPDKVIAYARPDEQKKIAKSIEEFNKPEPAERAKKIVVYPFKSTSATASYYTLAALRTMFPEATFSMGAEPDKLVVFARGEEHVKIKAAIDEVSKEDDPKNARQMTIYTVKLQGATVSGIIATLSAMYPDATFSVGTEPDKVIAYARPDEQKKIAKSVEEFNKPEPAERAKKIVVYPFKSTSATATSYTLIALRTMFPEAIFSTGAEPDKLVVFARGEEHVKIKAAIDEVSKEDDPKNARQMAIYTVKLQGATVNGIIATLSAMYPDATFSVGTEPDKVIAYARPDEQKKIAKSVEEFNKPESAERAKKIVVYPFKSTSATASYYTLAALRTMFPEATFSMGAEPDKLVVFARSEEHVKIKAAIDEVSKEDDPKNARQMTIYTVKLQGSYGVSGIIATLSAMYPDATFSVGTEPDKVIAYARPDEQKKIAKSVEEFNKPESAEHAKKIVVYPFDSVSPMASYYTIMALRNLFPGADFSVGAERDKLIVMARPDEHAKIEAAVKQLSQKDPPERARKMVVYTLRSTSPSGAGGAISLLTGLFHDAQFTAGSAPDKIVALARPDEHTRIAAAIEEFSRKEPPEKARTSAVYDVESVGYAPAVTFLSTGFPDAQFAAGSDPNKLLVRARPEDQAEIKAAIDALAAQVSKAAASDQAARLQIYPLKDLDSTSTLQVLTQLLQKQGATPELSLDMRSNSLVAIARPEHHKSIEAALAQLQTEERTLDIVQLDVLEPSTAEMAVERLFGDSRYAGRRGAPDVDADAATGQLFIRGTAEQHKKIRQLLIRMGETGLAPTPGDDTRRSRTIPFDGDVQAAVEEIKKVWPQLRDNPIHVVTPVPQILIRPRSSEKTPGKPATQPAPTPAPGAKTSPLAKPPVVQPAAGPEGTPPAKLPTNVAKPAAPPAAATSPAVTAPAVKTPAAATPAAANSVAKPAAEPAVIDKPAAQKPVVIMPGDGRITITSDDPAAAAQFEELLRGLSRQKGVVGRNYNIFMLKNAQASEVAATLRNLVRNMPYSAHGGLHSVVVVPEDRLNAVIVYANRTDRATVENLLKVLDAADVPENLSADRMSMIPVKSMSAMRMLRMLRDLHPAHAEGLSVETKTNSLLVMASPEMTDQVKQLVEKLDQAAGGPSSRTIQIVPLKKTSSERVEKALEILMRRSHYSQ